MAKSQKKSNRETRKPKKETPKANPPPHAVVRTIIAGKTSGT